LLRSRLFWKLFIACGVLVLLSTLALVPVFARPLTSRSIWLAAGVAAVAGMGLWVVLGRVIGPLSNLTQAAEELARGRLSRRVEATSRDEIGTLARALNSMSDQFAQRIAELERQGREIEENGERLRTVLTGMVEGVVAVDPSERVLFANRAAGRYFDVAADAAVGRPVFDVLRNPTVRQIIQDTLAGRDAAPIELEFPRSQTIVSLLPSRLPGRPSPGVVLVFHDVTELRRLENLRREFVSNVSHELKTPLTSIQAYTGTLLDGALEDRAVNRQFLERIDEQADRLHTLILDMLSLAKIESGREVFDMRPVDLRETARSVVRAHEARAESAGITLSHEYDDDGQSALTVTADPEGLRTILENLVDNALKYTAPGGRVTVRCGREDAAALVSVTDTGMGIAPEHQQRIFERFYRVDKARSRDQGGTGLGLAIVKHLAQVFGGGISVQSQPGQGSTFTVRLPMT
jgi:two-component system phosphate regulon sensor histidine kinase PhoR